MPYEQKIRPDPTVNRERSAGNAFEGGVEGKPSAA
jgi:hypothetical protein